MSAKAIKQTTVVNNMLLGTFVTIKTLATKEKDVSKTSFMFCSHPLFILYSDVFLPYAFNLTCSRFLPNFHLMP